MGTLVSTRAAVLAFAAMLSAGCWNGDKSSVHLGDVSIGRQILDLKAALDQEAITQAEYDRLKKALLALDQACDEGGD